MRKAYHPAQKREAVALARVAGVEAAAESLGIDRDRPQVVGTGR